MSHFLFKDSILVYISEHTHIIAFIYVVLLRHIYEENFVIVDESCEEF